MTILDKIIDYKKVEVAKAKDQLGYKALEKSIFFQDETLSVKQGIVKKGASGIIAEFKRQSPSKGIINNTAQVLDTAKGYLSAGASGLSILTDAQFFGGTKEDLISVKNNKLGPVLRKDFTISEYQIIEAKSIGADAILLIAAVLSKKEVQDFTQLAHSLGLEVLLEVHNQDELDCYIPEIDLVGINNRNLKTFTVDFENSIRLAEQLPKESVKIAESGISDFKNINRLRSHGFNGFLIGENFMKTNNPAQACKNFIEALKNSSYVA